MVRLKRGRKGKASRKRRGRVAIVAGRSVQKRVVTRVTKTGKQKTRPRVSFAFIFIIAILGKKSTAICAGARWVAWLLGYLVT